MSNTITNLLPDIYAALDVISRETTGFIPSVSRNSTIAQASIGDTVRVPVAPEATTADTTPGVNAPDTGDQTIDNVPVQILKSKHVPVRWNGEETKGLQNAGTFQSIQADRFYQAMRALVNEIERDLYIEAYTRASRGYGSAGNTPFATAGDLSDFAGVLSILEQNGAPKNDLQLALGHSAMGNLRGKQSSLFKVNEAGSSDMLRNGMTDRIMSMAIRHSDPIGLHIKGTGANYVTNTGSPYQAGQKTIAVDGGTGTILSGDVVTFAGDANKYVINDGTSGAGDTIIGGPGLQSSLSDGVAMSIGDNYTPNVAFARSAIVLATRAPAVPQGGDAATDRMVVTDPVTGLSFEISRYAQFKQVVYHVALAWGYKAIKPAHIALLMG